MNPTSGSGSSTKRFKKLYPQLSLWLGEHDIYVTTGIGDCIHRVRQALSDRSHFQILVAGGDGTMNEAVNAYLSGGKVICDDIPLGLINLGTGGDFFKTLEELNPNYKVALTENTYKFIDCGLIEMGEYKRFFANIASVGISGEVLKRMKESTYQSGPLSFYYHTLRTFLTYKPVIMQLEWKDEKGKTHTLSDAITNLFICNARMNGGGMRWGHAALLDDRLFDVTFVAGNSKFKLILESGEIYKGQLDRIDGVQTWRASEIVVRPEGQITMEIDGELPDTDVSTQSIRFSMHPAMIPVVL